MKRWQTGLINKEWQRFGLRKLSVGVASVLLGTTVYFGLGGTVVHADSQVDTVFSDTGSEEISSNVKVPYAAPIEPAQVQKVVNSAVNYDSNVVNSDTVNSNVENTNAVNNVADNKVEANNNIVANFVTQEMTINRNQVQPASVAQVAASTVQSSSNGGFDLVHEIEKKKDVFVLTIQKRLFSVTYSKKWVPILLSCKRYILCYYVTMISRKGRKANETGFRYGNTFVAN